MSLSTMPLRQPHTPLNEPVGGGLCLHDFVGGTILRCCTILVALILPHHASGRPVQNSQVSLCPLQNTKEVPEDGHSPDVRRLRFVLGS